MRTKLVLKSSVALMIALAGILLIANQQAQGVQTPPTIGTVGVMAFMVQDVKKGSPADQAGIKRGDLITFLNGAQVNSITDVQQTINGSGDKVVEVTYLRYNSDTSHFDELKVTVKPVPWGSWKAGR